MREDSKVSGNGLGFTSVLTLIFVTLKLLGKIDWSWWWVLSPLWIPLAIIGVFIVAVALLNMLVNGWRA